MNETQQNGGVPAVVDFAPTKQQFAEQINALVIRDQTTLDRAGSYVNALKTLISQIKATHKPVKTHWDRVHAAACAAEKADLAAPEALLAMLDGRVKTYVREESARREAEAEAEAERLQAEAEARALREAAKADAAGEPELARAIIEEAVSEAPVQPAAPERVKAAGIDLRESWDFDVTNADQIKREFTVPDLVTIGKIVRTMGKKAEQFIGGIAVKPKETIAKGRGA